jgi:hypothetical protein
MYFATFANAGSGPLSNRQGGGTRAGVGSESHLCKSQRRPAATRSLHGAGLGSCKGKGGGCRSRSDNAPFRFVGFLIG